MVHTCCATFCNDAHHSHRTTGPTKTNDNPTHQCWNGLLWLSVLVHCNNPQNVAHLGNAVQHVLLSYKTKRTHKNKATILPPAWLERCGNVLVLSLCICVVLVHHNNVSNVAQHVGNVSQHVHRTKPKKKQSYPHHGSKVFGVCSIAIVCKVMPNTLNMLRTMSLDQNKNATTKQPILFQPCPECVCVCACACVRV